MRLHDMAVVRRNSAPFADCAWTGIVRQQCLFDATHFADHVVEGADTERDVCIGISDFFFREPAPFEQRRGCGHQLHKAPGAHG